MELLKQRLNLDMVHVPYKGAAAANTDLLGGQISLYYIERFLSWAVRRP